MEETLEISELTVLKSAAGYYIGRTCVEDGLGPLPYSRESGYYPTREAAQVALDYLLYTPRSHP